MFISQIGPFQDFRTYAKSHSLNGTVRTQHSSETRNLSLRNASSECAGSCEPSSFAYAMHVSTNIRMLTQISQADSSKYSGPIDFE